MAKKYVFGVNLRYSDYSSKDGGYCVYSVYGEDPNCDLGGSHITPFIGNVEGTFQEVLEYAANNMVGFYAWGGGGHIIPMKDSKGNAEPIILNKQKKIRMERKEKLKKIINNNLDYIIDNLETMTYEDIKQELLKLKEII